MNAITDTILQHQDSDLYFTFKATGDPDAGFVVTSFRASERVSELYRIEIELASRRSDIDPADIIDRPGQLADSAVEAERRQEARGGIDPQSQREHKIERAIVAGSQRSAAQEAREAAAATEAADLIAEHPVQLVARTPIEGDALAKLRAEQERVLREIEGERAEAQSIKGQRMM